MHVMEVIDPTNLGAIHFVDENLNPIERKLTIKSVGKEKPPAGGKAKACLRFMEDQRCLFLANSQIKAIMNYLRTADCDKWAGAVLLLSAAPTKYAGRDCMGVVVKNAAYRKSAAQRQEAPDVQP